MVVSNVIPTQTGQVARAWISNADLAVAWSPVSLRVRVRVQLFRVGREKTCKAGHGGQFILGKADENSRGHEHGWPSILGWHNQEYAKDRNGWIFNLYSVMNRTDIFANSLTKPSVGMQWANPANDEFIGLWNFLRQIILSWELAVRLEYLDSGNSYRGFTGRILANLIISDLWLKHVQIILTDKKISAECLKKPETDKEKAKAEEFKEKGNDALKRREYQKAVDLYTEAIKIDLSNAVYRCNRSAALIGINKFETAEEDTYIATQLDPKYAKAWSRMGMAILKQGQGKRAKKAYEKALWVAGKDASPAMPKGLTDAEANKKKKKKKETVEVISSESDKEWAHSLRSAFLDEHWEIMGKTPEPHSLVHEQQVEGLLRFAERITLPYINETRYYAEDAYSTIRGGGHY
ncbi:hypothetical protein VTI28DRAFT_577 [Corynascus sepedonium]